MTLVVSQGYLLVYDRSHLFTSFAAANLPIDGGAFRLKSLLCLYQG